MAKGAQEKKKVLCFARRGTEMVKMKTERMILSFQNTQVGKKVENTDRNANFHCN